MQVFNITQTLRQDGGAVELALNHAAKIVAANLSYDKKEVALVILTPRSTYPVGQDKSDYMFRYQIHVGDEVRESDDWEHVLSSFNAHHDCVHIIKEKF